MTGAEKVYNTGIEKGAEDITPDNGNIYVIGVRATDVRTALNIGGVGILISFQYAWDPQSCSRCNLYGRRLHRIGVDKDIGY